MGSFGKVIKKHSNPTCMCHTEFKSQIRKENACLVLQPLSPTASFHALVSLLPANATLTAKAMAVRHSPEQHSQLYLASSWRCASATGSETPEEHRAVIFFFGEE